MICFPGENSACGNESHATDPIALDVSSITQLAQNLVGLPQEEAMRALRMCILARRRMDAGLLEAAIDAKHDALRSEGLLETVRRDASFADVAGLRRLRDWMRSAKAR